MKFVKYLFFIVVLLAIVFVFVGLFLPGQTHVERSVIIDAKPATVYPFISDLKEFSRWSPWARKDQNMQVEYSDITDDVGSTMTWRSDSPDTGSGSQEITSTEMDSRVDVALLFGEDMHAESSYIIEPVEEGTRVTWSFETDHGLNLFQRYLGLLMDDYLGPDFESGLQNLKQLVSDLPAIVTEEISYTAGGVDMTGYLAMPRNADNRPGILVVHEWWGHNEYVRERAEMLAELGYVAFAVDMYGDGKVAQHPHDAQKFMMEVVNNQEQAAARFNAALAVLKTLPSTNPEQTAAIGYCFGGAVVLSMARAGADLDGVASFHGALGNLAPVAENVEAEFLVLHGGDDPFITPEQEQAFKQSMDEAGLEYEFVEYENAKHGFTVPAATEKGEKFDLPLEYSPEADADSWERLKVFLEEIFEQQD